jgi:hypothetical protein
MGNAPSVTPSHQVPGITSGYKNLADRARKGAAMTEKQFKAAVARAIKIERRLGEIMDDLRKAGMLDKGGRPAKTGGKNPPVSHINGMGGSTTALTASGRP